MSITARSNGTLINKKPFKVLVCLVTLVAFLCNTVLIDVTWAVGTPSALPGSGADRAGGSGSLKELHVDTFTLPEHLGHIKDQYKANEPNKIIIHIQDAHCNYAAQQKIAEIIGYINKEYGINTVNLEGGAKAYDLSVFTDISDRTIRDRVADYFVKEGLVNGAEYFAVNNPEKVSLWGVEDTKLYIENLNVYRNSLTRKEEVDKHLKTLSHILSNLKSKIYSQELLEFDMKYGAYKANNIEFKDYLSSLVLIAKSKAIDIKSLPNIYLLNQTLGEEGGIDFKKANNERDELIDRLQKKFSKQALEELVVRTVEFKSEKISQKNFYVYLTAKAKQANLAINDLPELQKYIVYISMYDAIDKAKVMEEVDALENKVRDALCRNDEEKQLSALSKNLSLLKNIFGITLTKDDYKYYKANEESFGVRSFAAFISKNAPLYNIRAKLNDNITDLDQYRKEMGRFFEYSLKRDEAFLKNIRMSKSTIIVTGGFHTENLAELFKKQGISYISIMPNFKNCDGYECPYLNILSGKRNGVIVSLGVALSTMQVASLWNALGEVVDNHNAELTRIALIAIAHAEGNGRSFAAKTTSGDYLVLKEQSGFYVFSREADPPSDAEVVNEGNEIDTNDLGQVIWALHELGQDRVVREAFDKGINRPVDTAVIDEVKNILGYLGIKELSEAFEKQEGKTWVIPGLTAAHAGYKGIYITDKGNVRDKAIEIIHELIAGTRIGAPNSHMLAEDVINALRDGEIVRAKTMLIDAYRQPVEKTVWQIESQSERMKVDRDYADGTEKDVKDTVHKELQESGSVKEGYLYDFADMLAEFHIDIKKAFPKATFTLRDMIQLARFIRIYAEQIGLSEAFVKGAEFIYAGKLGQNNMTAFNTIIGKQSKRVEKFGTAATTKKIGEDFTKIIGQGVAYNGKQDKAKIGDVVVSIGPESADPAIPDLKALDPVYTKSLVDNMEAVSLAAEGSFALLLEGITALGKSFAIKVVAALKRQALITVGMSPALSSYEIIGGYHPKAPKYDLGESIEILKGIHQDIETPGTKRSWQEIREAMEFLGILPQGIEARDPQVILSQLMLASEERSGEIVALAQYLAGGRAGFEWKKGFLVQAMEEGKWLVLEELNLAPTEVLEVLNLYLVHKKLLVSQDGSQMPVKISPDFRLFATMNPTHYTGRQPPSEALLDRFIHRKVSLERKGEETELVEIIQRKLGLDSVWARALAKVHFAVADASKTWRSQNEAREPYEFNLRHILRVGHRLSGYDISGLNKRELARILSGIIWDVYAGGVRNPARKKEIYKFLNSILDLAALNITESDLDNFYPNTILRKDESTLTVGGVELKRGPSKGENIPDERHTLTPVVSTRKYQVQMARSLYIGEKRGNPEHILLTGPTAGGKTALAFDLFRQLGRPLHYVNLHDSMDVAALIGEYSITKGGAYRFQAGPLVQAMLKGEAIFIDEMNLSQMPEWFNTVLDDGVLWLPGLAAPVRAKSGFTVIGAMNPASLEGRQVISPALRSRFKEIWVDPITDTKELTEIFKDGLILDGIDAGNVAADIVSLHQELTKENPKAKYDLRTLLSLKEFLIEHYKRLSVATTIARGILQHYGGVLDAEKRNILKQKLKEDTRISKYGAIGASRQVSVQETPKDYAGYASAIAQRLSGSERPAAENILLALKKAADSKPMRAGGFTLEHPSEAKYFALIGMLPFVGFDKDWIKYVFEEAERDNALKIDYKKDELFKDMMNSAIALGRSGHRNEAIKILNIARELDEDGFIRRFEVVADIAEAMIKAGLNEDAYALLEKEGNKVLISIVRAQAEQGSYQDALATIDKADKMGFFAAANTYQVYSLLIVAEDMIKTNDIEKSKKLLARIIGIGDDQTWKEDLLIRLASIQGRLGYAREARDNFRKARRETEEKNLTLEFKLQKLRDIAKEEAMAGLKRDSKKAFDDIIKEARRITDKSKRETELGAIAMSQIEAGLYRDALDCAQDAGNFREGMLTGISKAATDAGEYDFALKIAKIISDGFSAQTTRYAYLAGGIVKARSYQDAVHFLGPAPFQPKTGGSAEVMTSVISAMAEKGSVDESLQLLNETLTSMKFNKDLLDDGCANVAIVLARAGRLEEALATAIKIEKGVLKADTLNRIAMIFFNDSPAAFARALEVNEEISSGKDLNQTITQGSAAGQVSSDNAARVVRIGDAELKIRPKTDDPDITADIPDLSKLSPVFTPALAETTEVAAFAATQNKPVVFEGKTALGKSFGVKVLAALTGNPLMTVNMHGALSSYEVLGGYRPRLKTRSLEEATRSLANVCREAETKQGWLNLVRILQIAGVAVREAVSSKDIQDIFQEIMKNSAEHEALINTLLDLIEGKQGNLEWRDGFLIEAMQKGKWLVLEELNLAPTEVLEALNLYLTKKCIIYWREGRQVELSLQNGGISPDFRFFATMNPAAMGGGRQRLSDALLSRFLRWHVDLTDEQQKQEWFEIFMARFGFEKSVAEQALLVHMEMIKRAKTWIKGASSFEKYEFNLRHLLRLGERLNMREKAMGKKYSEMPRRDQLIYLAAELQEVYGDALREKTQLDVFWDEILLSDAGLGLTKAGISRQDVESIYAPEKGRERAISREEALKIYPAQRIDGLNLPEGQSIPVLHIGKADLIRGPPNGLVIADSEVKLTPVNSTLRTQGKIARSLALSEHILLTGPTGAGKTSLILDLYRQLNQPIFYHNMSGSSSMDELVGTFHPTGKPGEYDFIPGLLVLAMETGAPILIDELNLSQLPEWFNTVLDEGVLWLPNGRRVKAKEGFCVIGAMNPPTADYEGRVVLSPALRSRFREIWTNEITDEGELRQIASAELSKVFQNAEAEKYSEEIVAIHGILVGEFPKIHFGIRQILRVVDMVNKLHEEMGYERAVAKAFELDYKAQLNMEDKEKFEKLTKENKALKRFWEAQARTIPEQPELVTEVETEEEKLAKEAIMASRDFDGYLKFIASRFSPETLKALEKAMANLKAKDDWNGEPKPCGLILFTPFVIRDPIFAKALAKEIRDIQLFPAHPDKEIVKLIRSIASFIEAGDFSQETGDAVEVFKILTDNMYKDSVWKTEVLSLIAYAQAKTGRKEESEKTFKEAIAAAEDIPMAQWNNKKSAFLIVAENQTKAGNLEAQATFEKAKKIVREKVEYMRADGLIKTQILLGLFDDAIASIEEFIKPEEGKVIELCKVALAQAKAKDPKALRTFTMAKDVSGGSAEALLSITRYQNESGLMKESRQTLLETEAAFSEGRFRQGNKAYVARDLAQAQILFGFTDKARETIKYAGDTIGELGQMAITFARIKDSGEAGRLITEMKLRASSKQQLNFKARALNDVAYYQLETGDTQGAAKTLQEAVSAIEAFPVSRNEDRWERNYVLKELAKRQGAAGFSNDCARTITLIGRGEDTSEQVYWLAMAYLKNKDYQSARNTANTLPKDSWLRSALRNIAFAQAGEGSFDEARVTAQGLKGAQGGDDGYDATMAQINDIEAIAFFESMKGNINNDVRTAEELLQKSLSIAMNKTRQQGSAAGRVKVAEVKKDLASYVRFVSRDIQQEAREYIDQALALIDSEWKAEAQLLLLPFFIEDETFPTLLDMETFKHMGMYLSSAAGKIGIPDDRLQKALNRLRESVEACCKDDPVAKDNALGGILYLQLDRGFMEDALTTLKAIRFVDSMMTDALRWVSEALARRGDKKEALRYANEITDKDFRDNAIRGVAAGLIESGYDEDKAMEVIKENGVTISKESRLEILDARIKIRLKNNRLDEAEALAYGCSSARERNHALNSIGQYYLAQNDLDIAAKYFSNAGADDYLYESLAFALAARGDFAAARAKSENISGYAAKWKAQCVVADMQARSGDQQGSEAFLKDILASTHNGNDPGPLFAAAVIRGRMASPATKQTYQKLEELFKRAPITSSTADAIYSVGMRLGAFRELLLLEKKLGMRQTMFIARNDVHGYYMRLIESGTFLRIVSQAAPVIGKNIKALESEMTQTATQGSAANRIKVSEIKKDIASYVKFLIQGGEQALGESFDEMIKLLDSGDSFEKTQGLKLALFLSRYDEYLMDLTIEEAQQLNEVDALSACLVDIAAGFPVPAFRKLTQKIIDISKDINDSERRNIIMTRVINALVGAGMYKDALAIIATNKDIFDPTALLCSIAKALVVAGEKSEAENILRSEINKAIALPVGRRISILCAIAAAQSEAGLAEAKSTLNMADSYLSQGLRGHEKIDASCCDEVAKLQEKMGLISEAESTLRLKINTVEHLSDITQAAIALTLFRLRNNKTRGAEKAFREAVSIVKKRAERSSSLLPMQDFHWQISRTGIDEIIAYHIDAGLLQDAELVMQRNKDLLLTNFNYLRRTLDEAKAIQMFKEGRLQEGIDLLRKLVAETECALSYSKGYNYYADVLIGKVGQKEAANILKEEAEYIVRTDRATDSQAHEMLYEIVKALVRAESFDDASEIARKIVRSTYYARESKDWIAEGRSKKLIGKLAGIRDELGMVIASNIERISQAQTQTAAQGSAAERVKIAESRATKQERFVESGTLYIGETSLPIYAPSGADNVPDKEKLGWVEIPSTVDMMEQAALSVRLKQAILFIGETALGKSFAIKILAALTRHPYRAVGMHPALTTYEMLGGYHPTGKAMSRASALTVFDAAIADARRTGNWQKLIRASIDSGLILKAEELNKPETLGGIRQNDDQLIAIATILGGVRANLEWRDGFLVDAMMRGEWLVLEELNLASSDILEALNHYLVFGKLRIIKEGKWVEVPTDSHFHLFATMNPLDYANRFRLSKALTDRFINVNVTMTKEQQEEELQEILQVKFGLNEGRARQLLMLHMGLVERSSTLRGDLSSKERYEFNLRHLLRVGDRIALKVRQFAGLTEAGYDALNSEQRSELTEKWFSSMSARDQLLTVTSEIWEVYIDGIRDRVHRPALFAQLGLAYQLGEYKITQKDVEDYYASEAVKDGTLSFQELLDFYSENDLEKLGFSRDDTDIAVAWVGKVPLLKGAGKLTPKPEESENIPDEKTQVYTVNTTLKYMGKIARSIFRSEHVLLVGGTGAGKTSIVFNMFRELGRALFYINFHNGVNIDELVGGWHFNKQGQLQFTKGLLAKAMESGSPIYIDELNLSDMPEWFNTVMDDGVLWLPNGDKITARPGFMVIGSMNPPKLAGRVVLSPALRSRFREIWVDEISVMSELSEIALHTLNGIGAMLLGFKEGWDRAIKVAAEKLQVPAMLIWNSQLGRAVRWGLESLRNGPTASLEMLSENERQAISKFAREAGLPQERLAELEAKVEEVKEVVKSVAIMAGRDRRLNIVPGDGWAFKFDDNSITYPLSEILTSPVENIIGSALHEGAHRDISRINPDTEIFKFFFEQETRRLLLNAFEDPRVNNWSIRRFAGGRHFMDALYDTEFPEDGKPRRKDAYARSILAEAGIEVQGEAAGQAMLLPHMQYILGVIHFWRHGKVAPFVTDGDAASALNATSSRFKGIFEALPQNQREIEKQKTAEAVAQVIRDEIYPTYELLIKKSQQQIEQMIKEGKIKPSPGKGEGKGEGKGKGMEIPPELLPEKAKQILEDQAKKVADSLEGKDEIPRVKEAKERAKREKGEAHGEAKPADPNKPLSAKDIIIKSHRMNRQREASLTTYQKYLEPVAEASDRLRGILGNIFFKNARPRDIGWFRSGKPSIPKIMQSEARGWMNEEDFKVMTRRLLPTKRNYRFSLVIDQSGSMAGHKAERAMQAAVLFMETLEYLDIDYSIMGFSDEPSEYKEFGKGRLDEESRNEVISRTVMGSASGGTNDKAGIAEATDKMKLQDADRKIIVVITDGEGTNGPISPELAAARENGIEVIGVGIGEGMGYVKKNYDYSVLAHSADELPELVGELLEEGLLGEPDITPAKAQLLKSEGRLVQPEAALEGSRGISGLANDIYSEPIKAAILGNTFVAFAANVQGGFDKKDLDLDSGLKQSGRTIDNAAQNKMQGALAAAYELLDGEDRGLLREAAILLIEGLDEAVRKDARALPSCYGTHYGIARNQYYFDIARLKDSPQELARHLHHEIQERNQTIRRLTDDGLIKGGIVPSAEQRSQPLKDAIDRIAKEEHDKIIRLETTRASSTLPQVSPGSIAPATTVASQEAVVSTRKVLVSAAAKSVDVAVTDRKVAAPLALQAALNHDAKVRLVVGVRKGTIGMNGEKINKEIGGILAKAGYGATASRSGVLGNEPDQFQIKVFEFDEGSYAESAARALSNAYDGLDNGRVIFCKPAFILKDEEASIAEDKEILRKALGDNITDAEFNAKFSRMFSIQDNYSDSVDTNHYPDIVGRWCLARLVAYGLDCQDALNKEKSDAPRDVLTGVLRSLNDYINKLSGAALNEFDIKEISKLDPNKIMRYFFNRLGLLKIKAIDYEEISDFFRAQKEIASAA